MNAVTTLRTGFLDADDRLLIDFVYPDRIETMLITRRVLRRILHGVAQVLAASSPMLAKVPASHKSEMLAWEHLAALQPAEAGQGGSEPEAPQQRRPAPWGLLTKLDITTQPTGFQLRFEDGKGLLVPMSVSRPDLHRLLANLRKLARHAEWDLDTEIGWLVEADAPQMQPGHLAS